MRDWNKDEGQKKKVERVQCPAEETGDKSIALSAAQRLEHAQRFHRPVRQDLAPLVPKLKFGNVLLL